MRSAIALLSALSLISMSFEAAAGPPLEQAPYHIVLSRQSLRAGETVEMKLLPPVPPGARVTWPEGTGKTNLIYSRTYRAPYVIPAGSPPITLGVGISGAGLRATASTEIHLIPSSVPGTEDCLGPEQFFSTTSGTFVSNHGLVDELPEAIHRATPSYPRSLQARGMEDTLTVIALVCRTGSVLDAYVPYAYRNIGDLQPVERDPRMVEAALEAVRQYVFKPALISGQPIATWVAVPVPFSLD